jgi:transcription initiation factor TFIID subunit 2
MTAIGNAFSASGRDPDMTREALDAVDRAITMDRLVPSYQNIVTEAGLKTTLKFVLASHKTNDARLFLSYTR